MKTYKAKKGTFPVFILLSLILPLMMWLNKENLALNYTAIALFFLPFAILLWILLSTKYYIIGDVFHYRSAFLFGKIEISKIKAIQKNKTLWSGVKPAMATKGLIIKFGYDEIYVAPQSNDTLIEDFLAVNPKITVIT